MLTFLIDTPRLFFYSSRLSFRDGGFVYVKLEQHLDKELANLSNSFKEDVDKEF